MTVDLILVIVSILQFAVFLLAFLIFRDVKADLQEQIDEIREATYDDMVTLIETHDKWKGWSK